MEYDTFTENVSASETLAMSGCMAAKEMILIWLLSCAAGDQHHPSAHSADEMPYLSPS